MREFAVFCTVLPVALAAGNTYDGHKPVAVGVIRQILAGRI